MAEIPSVKEKYTGKIEEIVFGNCVAGGADGMPFLSFENTLKRRPMIAGEVVDDLTDYPEIAAEMFDGRQKDPVEWANMWKEIGADMICMRFPGAAPDKKGTTPDAAVSIVKSIAEKTGLPIMVTGCGIPDIDNKLAEAVGGAMKGTKIILGKTEEHEYKKISAVCVSNGHAVLAFSNLDINLAKQMNILLTDFGVGRDGITMDPLMAALGMGLDYSYSVNERIRLAALSGDRMLQVPMVCDCTGAWDVGDAVSTDDPSLGDAKHRVAWWEAMTALAAMLSGADILVMRGPGAADMARVYDEELTGVS